MKQVPPPGAKSDHSTRFQKGKSGNPKGRPQAKEKPQPSVFDVVLDRQFQTERDGERRELSVEEALQHKLLQQAMSGSRPAQRKILQMIEKRHAKLADQQKASRKRPMKREYPDPDSAHEAMLLLGICSRSGREVYCWMGPFSDLRFEPWAVKLAFDRGIRPDAMMTTYIRGWTQDAHSIAWPTGSRKE